MLVGREGLSVDDADRGQLSGSFGVQGVGGLLLNDGVDLFEEREVVGVDAVERRRGEVDETSHGRRVRRGEWVDARGEERVQSVQRADDDPVRVRRRPEHEVALGHLPVMVGRQEQVLAALAPVGAGVAEIRDIPLPQIVDEAQRVRRRLDHGRSVRLEVQERRAVRRLGVGGQDHRSRGGAWIGTGDHVRPSTDARSPRLIANIDAPGMQFKKASIPRIRSSAS